MRYTRPYKISRKDLRRQTELQKMARAMILSAYRNGMAAILVYGLDVGDAPDQEMTHILKRLMQSKAGSEKLRMAMATRLLRYYRIAACSRQNLIMEIAC